MAKRNKPCVVQEDHRRYPRRFLRIPAIIKSEHHGSFIGQVVEVSRGGLSVEGPNQLAMDEVCTVLFMLPLADGTQRNISAVTRVVYCIGDTQDGFKTGFDFKDAPNEQVE